MKTKRTAVRAPFFFWAFDPSRLASPRTRRLGRHAVHFGSQPRLVTRRRVLMKHAFLNRSIDDRDCLPENCLCLIAISAFYRGAKFLDLSAQMASIAAVYFVAPDGLPYAFLC